MLSKSLLYKTKLKFSHVHIFCVSVSFVQNTIFPTQRPKRKMTKRMSRKKHGKIGLRVKHIFWWAVLKKDATQFLAHISRTTLNNTKNQLLPLFVKCVLLDDQVSFLSAFTCTCVLSLWKYMEKCVNMVL